MGVKELWSVVSPTGQLLPLTALTGQSVAVDLSCWIVDTKSLNLVQVTQPHLRCNPPHLTSPNLTVTHLNHYLIPLHLLPSFPFSHLHILHLRLLPLPPTTVTHLSFPHRSSTWFLYQTCPCQLLSPTLLPHPHLHLLNLLFLPQPPFLHPCLTTIHLTNPPPLLPRYLTSPCLNPCPLLSFLYLFNSHPLISRYLTPTYLNQNLVL
ncbi:hypothetical protein Pmani_001023 [Petrolisthes manimaculis]|uniref:Uncharacterized protein n=1 Tax=Petrolisthes manimaculis TaxID=1843537 RepID=A0AAE1QKS6_9EUCA|nr:hypothetical protein Pmani_001023 [Petrolisthes manimaculis]